MIYMNTLHYDNEYYLIVLEIFISPDTVETTILRVQRAESLLPITIRIQHLSQIAA